MEKVHKPGVNVMPGRKKGPIFKKPMPAPMQKAMAVASPAIKKFNMRGPLSGKMK